MMRKAVLQNCKALDTAFQGDICAIIQSECYIFIPNKSFNVTHLINHMKNQISALNDPFPSFDEHHRFDGHEFGWTQGVGDGQGGLACCNSWGRKESDTTERLNWTELNWMSLTISFAICLFHKIIISCITKCMTEPPPKIMMTRLEAVDQMYSSI